MRYTAHPCHVARSVALDAELARNEDSLTESREAARLARERAAAEQCLALAKEDRALQQATLQAQVDAAVRASQAFSPQLVSAVNRLGDQALLERMAENFGELAAVEGRGLLETARRYLDFVPQTLMPVLQPPPEEPAQHARALLGPLLRDDAGPEPRAEGRHLLPQHQQMRDREQLQFQGRRLERRQAPLRFR